MVTIAWEGEHLWPNTLNTTLKVNDVTKERKKKPIKVACLQGSFQVLQETVKYEPSCRDSCNTYTFQNKRSRDGNLFLRCKWDVGLYITMC